MRFELSKTEPKTENDPPMVWHKWYEGVKADGAYSIKVDRLSFKDETQPVFFAINEAENVGISVFAAHHPEAKFTDATPHGVRLANAIGRAFKLEGEVSAEDLCEAVNNHDNATITVKKTDKGILWSVVLVAAKKSKK